MANTVTVTSIVDGNDVGEAHIYLASDGSSGELTDTVILDASALAGATPSGQFLRGNGTNVVMSAIQASDVPTLNQSSTVYQLIHIYHF